MRAVSNPAKHAGRASWIFIIRTCLLHLWTHRFWKLSLGKQGLLVHSSLPIKEFTEVIIMGRNQCMICSVFLYLILCHRSFSHPWFFPLILSWIKGYEGRRQVNSCKIKRNEVVYQKPDNGQTFLSVSLKTGEKGQDEIEKSLPSYELDHWSKILLKLVYVHWIRF